MQKEPAISELVILIFIRIYIAFFNQERFNLNYVICLHLQWQVWHEQCAAELNSSKDVIKQHFTAFYDSHKSSTELHGMPSFKKTRYLIGIHHCWAIGGTEGSLPYTLLEKLDGKQLVIATHHQNHSFSVSLLLGTIPLVRVSSKYCWKVLTLPRQLNTGTLRKWKI